AYSAPHVFVTFTSFELFMNLVPSCGFFQTRNQRLRASLVIFRWNQRPQRSGRSHIGILIRGYVDAAAASIFYSRDDLWHFAPVLLARDFQVKDFYGNIRLSS